MKKPPVKAYMRAKWLRKVLRKLFVDDCNCILCGDELKVIDGSGLCEKCHELVVPVGERYCERCGKPMSNEAYFCLECQNTHRYFERARAGIVYSGATHKLLLNYKFHNKRYLARYLARYIESAYKRFDYDCDVIIPAPISAERLKQRGYNQVELMLEELEGIDLPIIADAVVKVKNNNPQTELSGRDRRENVKGVYKVIDKTEIKGKRVLLVDDILTTGATVNELSRVLMIAGAKSVEVITVAVTPYKLPMEGEERENFDDAVPFL